MDHTDNPSDEQSALAISSESGLSSFLPSSTILASKKNSLQPISGCQSSYPDILSGGAGSGVDRAISVLDKALYDQVRTNQEPEANATLGVQSPPDRHEEFTFEGSERPQTSTPGQIHIGEGLLKPSAQFDIHDNQNSLADNSNLGAEAEERKVSDSKLVVNTDIASQRSGKAGKQEEAVQAKPQDPEQRRKVESSGEAVEEEAFVLPRSPGEPPTNSDQNNLSYFSYPSFSKKFINRQSELRKSNVSKLNNLQNKTTSDHMSSSECDTDKRELKLSIAKLNEVIEPSTGKEADMAKGSIEDNSPDVIRHPNHQPNQISSSDSSKKPFPQPKLTILSPPKGEAVSRVFGSSNIGNISNIASIGPNSGENLGSIDSQQIIQQQHEATVSPFSVLVQQGIQGNQFKKGMVSPMQAQPTVGQGPESLRIGVIQSSSFRFSQQSDHNNFPSPGTPSNLSRMQRAQILEQKIIERDRQNSMMNNGANDISIQSSSHSSSNSSSSSSSSSSPQSQSLITSTESQFNDDSNMSSSQDSFFSFHSSSISSASDQQMQQTNISQSPNPSRAPPSQRGSPSRSSLARRKLTKSATSEDLLSKARDSQFLPGMRAMKTVQRKDNVYENINIQEKIEDFSARQKMKKRTKAQRLLERIITHNYMTMFISIITLLVLYADDLRNIFFEKDQDMKIDIVLILCILIFTLEMVVQIICLSDYLWSFFFWLDLVSLISMPMDVYFLIQFLTGESDSLIFQTDDASNVARVGRASRVGTKAGRYIKIVKLIRIVKVAKFFKQTNTLQNKRQEILLKKVAENRQIQQEALKEDLMNVESKDQRLVRGSMLNNKKASTFLMRQQFFDVETSPKKQALLKKSTLQSRRESIRRVQTFNMDLGQQSAKQQRLHQDITRMSILMTKQQSTSQLFGSVEKSQDRKSEQNEDTAEEFKANLMKDIWKMRKRSRRQTIAITKSDMAECDLGHSIKTSDKIEIEVSDVNNANNNPQQTLTLETNIQNTDRSMLSPVREEEGEDNRAKASGAITDKNPTNPTTTNKMVSEEFKDSGTEMQSIKVLNSKIKDSIDNSIQTFGFKRAVTQQQPRAEIDIINQQETPRNKVTLELPTVSRQKSINSKYSKSSNKKVEGPQSIPEQPNSPGIMMLNSSKSKRENTLMVPKPKLRTNISFLLSSSQLGKQPSSQMLSNRSKREKEHLSIGSMTYSNDPTNELSKSQESKKEKDSETEPKSWMDRFFNLQDEDANIRESRVSKKFQEMTTMRVVSIVLICIMVTPFLDASVYVLDNTTPADYMVKILKSDLQFDIVVQPDTPCEDKLSYKEQFLKIPNVNELMDKIDEFNQKSNDKIIDLSVKNCSTEADDVIYAFDNITRFRPTDFVDHYDKADENNDFNIRMSKEKENQILAIISTVKTTFVCVVLVFSSLSIQQDAQELVLNPLEAIMEKVNRMAVDPFQVIFFNDGADNPNAARSEVPTSPSASNMEVSKRSVRKISDLEDNFGALSSQIMDKREKKQQKQEKQQRYETKVLDDAITKIGTLLVLGFGEAGSFMVSKNLSQFGNVDSSLKGNKSVAIFGFCDIRKFTETTEALQERVMLFVNDIAKIVHGISCEYLGIPNKNIGDAFLIVWKLPKSEIDDEKYKIISKRSYILNNIADCSVISVLKIIIKLNCEESIIKYRYDKQITQRQGEGNYRVALGFGLHVGIAIEGAIGSDFKIDATYLSKDVELASYLESLTKQYGCQLIMSGELVAILSKQLRSMPQIRQIDQIQTLAEKRYEFYTFTLGKEIDNLPPINEIGEMTNKDYYNYQMHNRFLKMQTLAETDPDLQQPFHMLFESDLELNFVASPQSPEMIRLQRLHKKLFSFYILGHWNDAMTHVRQITSHPEFVEDGPTLFIKTFIEEHKQTETLLPKEAGGEIRTAVKYVPPADWMGYRKVEF